MHHTQKPCNSKQPQPQPLRLADHVNTNKTEKLTLDTHNISKCKTLQQVNISVFTAVHLKLEHQMGSKDDGSRTVTFVNYRYDQKQT